MQHGADSEGMRFNLWKFLGRVVYSMSTLQGREPAVKPCAGKAQVGAGGAQSKGPGAYELTRALPMNSMPVSLTNWRTRSS